MLALSAIECQLSGGLRDASRVLVAATSAGRTKAPRRSANVERRGAGIQDRGRSELRAKLPAVRLDATLHTVELAELASSSW